MDVECLYLTGKPWYWEILRWRLSTAQSSILGAEGQSTSQKQVQIWIGLGKLKKLDWRGILESNNIFRAEKQYLGAGNTESVNLLGAYGLSKSWGQRVGQHFRSRETFNILEAESQSTSWEQRVSEHIRSSETGSILGAES